MSNTFLSTLFSEKAAAIYSLILVLAFLLASADLYLAMPLTVCITVNTTYYYYFFHYKNCCYFSGVFPRTGNGPQTETTPEVGAETALY
jgi:hypothetical protein